MSTVLRSINKPEPIPTSISQYFWERARQQELVIQKCQACGTSVFYPRNRCPVCWENSLEWISSRGKGVLASFTIVRRPGHKAFQSEVPYTVALVDLDEGPRLLTNLVGEFVQSELKIGSAVEVAWVKEGNYTYPKFYLSNPFGSGV